MYNRIICAENQRIIRCNIIINFTVGGIPDIVLTAELFTNLVKPVPIVMIVKLKAMSPKIEKARI